MKSTPEVEQLRDLLTDTITLLIKNGLKYKAEFCVEALIGITLDQEDVVLVNIKEIVKDALRANQSSQQREPPEQEDNIRSNSVRALNKRKIDKEDHGSSPIKQLRMSAENSLDGEDSFQSDPKSNSNEDHSHSEVVVKQEPSDDFSTQADSDLDTSLGQRPALSCWPDATFQGPPDSSQIPMSSPAAPPSDWRRNGNPAGRYSTATGGVPHPLTDLWAFGSSYPINSNMSHQLDSTLDTSKSTVERYACQFCSRRFSLRHNLTRHIKGVHRLGQTYDCVCGASFYWAGTLKKHQARCELVVKESETAASDTPNQVDRNAANIVRLSSGPSVFPCVSAPDVPSQVQQNVSNIMQRLSTSLAVPGLIPKHLGRLNSSFQYEKANEAQVAQNVNNILRHVGTVREAKTDPASKVATNKANEQDQENSSALPNEIRIKSEFPETEETLNVRFAFEREGRSENSHDENNPHSEEWPVEPLSPIEFKSEDGNTSSALDAMNNVVKNIV